MKSRTLIHGVFAVVSTFIALAAPFITYAIFALAQKLFKTEYEFL